MNTSTDTPNATMARTIRALMWYRGDLSDRQLGALVGMKRGTINQYTAGRASITVEIMEKVANALDVDVEVLHKTPDDALQWAMENRPSGKDLGQNPCLFQLSLFDTVSTGTANRPGDEEDEPNPEINRQSAVLAA